MKLALLAFCFALATAQNVEEEVEEIQELLEEERHTLPFQPRRIRDGDELLFVSVVWRHGDRAPVMTYPTDKWQESAWHNGWGELTELGMTQQYALGRVLHNRYMNFTPPFLSKQYNSKEIYIRSTDVNRTLISAYSNLAGLFADGVPGEDMPSFSRWPSHWTPIPVHTLDVNDDHEGNIFAPCKRAEQLDEQIKNSESYINLVRENQEFLDFISEKTGMTVTLPLLYLINDVHHIEMIYNMSQPEWLTPNVSTHMRELTEKGSEYLYGIADPYVPELIRLRGGNMLRSILDNMNLKLNCHKKNNTGAECAWIGPLKYYAYSAHDTTVAALLTTLGDEQKVIRGGLPKYTASVAFELWNLEDIGPAIKILFHTAFHHNYHVITNLTKGCPRNREFCPLKMFEKRSLKFLPVDIKRECAHTTVDNRTKPRFYKGSKPTSNGV